jgi:hypothetical protein
MSEAVAEQPTQPPASDRRKLPMAVSLVGILVALAAIVNLVSGALMLVALHRLGGLPAARMLEAPFATTAVSLGATTLTLQPLDGVYLLAVGLIQLLLLFGFRRQRTWAWLGLMAWSGLQLAVVLYRYLTSPASDHLREYMIMAIHSVVVLTLNAQEVQEAFGLRKPAPPAVPIRPAPPTSEVPAP